MRISESLIFAIVCVISATLVFGVPLYFRTSDYEIKKGNGFVIEGKVYRCAVEAELVRTK